MYEIMKEEEWEIPNPKGLQQTSPIGQRIGNKIVGEERIQFTPRKGMIKDIILGIKFFINLNLSW